MSASLINASKEGRNAGHGDVGNGNRKPETLLFSQVKTLSSLHQLCTHAWRIWPIWRTSITHPYSATTCHSISRDVLEKHEALLGAINLRSATASGNINSIRSAEWLQGLSQA